MRSLLPQPVARSCVAASFTAFGIQHLMEGAFVTRAAFAPNGLNTPLLATVAGGILLVAGAMLLVPPARQGAALILALLGWGTTLAVKMPELISDVHAGAVWTTVGKGFALPATALVAAFSLSRSRMAGVLLTLAALALGGFFILAAVQHAMYAGFVATLVPRWIPFPLFWTWFAAASLLAGGIGLWLPRWRATAAWWCGLMIFIWTWSLHLPRALQDLHNPNETTSFFEALTVAAGCFLLSGAAVRTSATRNASSPPPAH